MRRKKKIVSTTWHAKRYGRPDVQLRVPASVVRELKLEKANRKFEWEFLHEDGDRLHVILTPIGRKIQWP